MIQKQSMKIAKAKNTDKTQSQLTNYTPVRPMLNDAWGFPSIFDDFFSRSLMPNYSSLSADIWEEEDIFFIKMALPGIDKDNVDIEIDADTVRIKGSKKQEQKENDSRKYYFKSLDTQFEQSFNLPTVVDADKAEASFKDGILEVKLPKAEAYKPKKVNVN